MKGIVTCYNAMSVILLVENTSNCLLLIRFCWYWLLNHDNCLANNSDTLIKYFIFISFECEI